MFRKAVRLSCSSSTSVFGRHDVAGGASPSGSNEGQAADAGGHRQIKRLLGAALACSVIFSMVLLSACDGDDEPGPLPEVQPLPPEFVCPIPERMADDPATELPEADENRVRLEPSVAANCELPSKTLHRLNRAEYDNAVRDLFGATSKPAREFPADHTDKGFDNIVEVQAISPILVEKYFEAARQVADEALYDGVPHPETVVYEAEGSLAGAPEDGVARIETGNREMDIPIHTAGRYIVRVMAFGEQAGNEPVRMEVTLGWNGDAQSMGIFEVTATEDEPRLYEGALDMEVGTHKLVVRFLNDYNRPEDRGEVALDRNLIVDFVEVDGPHGAEAGAPSPKREQILTCDPDVVPEDGSDPVDRMECGREILTPLLEAALRRPAEPGEVDRYVGFLNVAAAEGQSFEHGLKLAFRALLLHPEFLFRVETDPDLDDATAHRVSDHELASRLSFFLWSSMPDPRLRALADQGALHDEVVLEGEVRRMLRDPKAQALVENLGGQWLSTRLTADVHLDPAQFPTWGEEMRDSARCETEMLFDDVLRNGGTLEDLFTADYTFLNSRLAGHYGLPDPGVTAPEGANEDAAFARVSLEGSERAGVLTHASVLSINSHPNRTSPVRRGKWVLEQLLCEPPPPPPPMVEGLDESQSGTAQTLRETLARHREDPACAGCHNLMDPIGLGLENFGADGRYRAEDDGLPIDASSMLFNVEPFDGPKELASLLVERDEPTRCAVEKTLTYATGVPYLPTGDTACTVEEATEAYRESDHSLEELMVLVTRTAAFRYRRADPALDAAAELAAAEDPLGEAQP